MSEPTKPSDGSLLRRWSRLKTEAREKEKVTDPAKAAAPVAAVNAAHAPAEPSESPDARLPGAPTNAVAAAAGELLPPVESLTIDSDFSAFMQPTVDETLKRRALKQLFRDPHFNVMDGLDVYIDDYSKPDPIAPEIVRQMVQARYIFNPPPTRINAAGNVEDIPEEEVEAMPRDGSAKSQGDGAEGGAAAISQLPTAEVDAAAVLPLATRDAASTAVRGSADSDEETDSPAKDPAAP